MHVESEHRKYESSSVSVSLGSRNDLVGPAQGEQEAIEQVDVPQLQESVEWDHVPKSMVIDGLSEADPKLATFRKRWAEGFTWKCFKVPYIRNPHFTGRDDLLFRLFEMLSETKPKQYNHRVAIYGIPGVGKTQLAIEYCYRFGDFYPGIYWI